METFNLRRDRFDFFENFENPLLNLTVKIETTNFLPYCRDQKLPPFHFFLFCLYKAILRTENFLYRIHDGEVIKITELIPNYTVMNEHNDLNFAQFEYSSEIREFIDRSLVARDEATATVPLTNTGFDYDPRRVRDFVFITCIPWLDFLSIQHPVYKSKSADIPSIAWGKMKDEGTTLSMPFSVQAHHGFVDGFHVHQLIENLKACLVEEIRR